MIEVDRLRSGVQVSARFQIFVLTAGEMSYVGREIVRRGNCPGGICARGMSYTQMRRHIVSPSRPIRFLLSSRYQMTLRHFCHLCFSLSPVVSDLNATVFKCLTCTARSVSNARFTRCVSLKSITCVIVYRTSFTGIVFCIFVHFHV